MLEKLSNVLKWRIAVTFGKRQLGVAALRWGFALCVAWCVGIIPRLDW
jgi:hypothetical protein